MGLEILRSPLIEGKLKTPLKAIVVNFESYV